MQTKRTSASLLALALVVLAAGANLAFAASSSIDDAATNEASLSTRPKPSRYATLITPDPNYEPLM